LFARARSNFSGFRLGSCHAIPEARETGAMIVDAGFP
jgi:hypothetical protein